MCSVFARFRDRYPSCRWFGSAETESFVHCVNNSKLGYLNLPSTCSQIRPRRCATLPALPRRVFGSRRVCCDCLDNSVVHILLNSFSSFEKCLSDLSWMMATVNSSASPHDDVFQRQDSTSMHGSVLPWSAPLDKHTIKGDLSYLPQSRPSVNLRPANSSSKANQDPRWPATTAPRVP